MLPAIRVENLGKSYCVNHAEERLPYKTFRDSLSRMATAPIRRFKAGGHTGTVEEFWALKDVSFDVQPGEVVGIIGRNGAGKSTLLKIMSRITKPSTGRVTIRGRVGSLLEVGTGFHPELTGRENIYMNGSILGMSRAEIRRKFDEIVDFSGVEKFLDTPVKRYSSGMQVRLAFAVAAHLEPEIVIVDEVLAVGDMEFQRRCLGKMEDVARSGRTVLFVSHNMAAIEALCEKGILLENGFVSEFDEVTKVVRNYCRTTLASVEIGGHELKQLGGGRRKHRIFEYAEILDGDGRISGSIPLGDDLRLRLHLQVPHHVNEPTIGIGFDDVLGQRVLTIHTPRSQPALHNLAGKHLVECFIPSFPLAPGDYWIKLAFAENGSELDAIDRAFCLRIAESDAFGDGRGFTRGICIAACQWELVTNSSHKSNQHQTRSHG